MKDAGHHNAGRVLLSRAMTAPAKRNVGLGARFIAPPGFERREVASYGDARSESFLVRGENLDAMRRLVAAGLAGRFRCIYFDPPYNSGRRFAEYDDALTPDAWRAMIAARVEVSRELLHDTGTLVIQIGDTELGALET